MAAIWQMTFSFFLKENVCVLILTEKFAPNSGIDNNSHYDDVIMGAMASQITSLTIVYSTLYWGTDQSKHQSSASLAFVWGIHRGPVNSPHKWPVTRKMFPFDDIIKTLGQAMAWHRTGNKPLLKKIYQNIWCNMATWTFPTDKASWLPGLNIEV